MAFPEILATALPVPTSVWRALVREGVITILLVALILLGATTFAADLQETKTASIHNSEKLDALATSLKTLIKINRQTCLIAAGADSAARTGCLVDSE